MPFSLQVTMYIVAESSLREEVTHNSYGAWHWLDALAKKCPVLSVTLQASGIAAFGSGSGNSILRHRTSMNVLLLLHLPSGFKYYIHLKDFADGEVKHVRCVHILSVCSSRLLQAFHSSRGVFLTLAL